MKNSHFKVLLAGAICVAGGAALAQSPEYMIEACNLSSQQFYGDFEAQAEATYQGQRTDGTHAVNGTIYLENRSSDFSCSYNSAGDTLVAFAAEGQYWSDFVRGGGSPYHASSGGSTSAPSISTERVRFPSGASSVDFPAQLPPGMTVRYQLGARNGQLLDVNIAPANAPLIYRILNPDGSELLGEIGIDTPYRGQLWQSGDHVVEVINRTGSIVPIDIYFGID